MRNTSIKSQRTLSIAAESIIGCALLLGAMASPSALAAFPEGVRTFSGEISDIYAHADGTRFVVLLNQRVFDNGAQKWIGYRCGAPHWLQIPSAADSAMFEVAQEAAIQGRTVQVVAEEYGKYVASPVLQSITAWHPVTIRNDLVYPLNW